VARKAKVAVRRHRQANARLRIPQSHACVAELDCPKCQSVAGVECRSRNGYANTEAHMARYRQWASNRDSAVSEPQQSSAAAAVAGS
jgi:hypothetical protein